MASKTVNSRDGQWAYEVLDCGRVITVTHKASGEILRVRSSLTSLRKQAASGDLLRTVERVAYQRDHKMASRLDQHLGREVLVDGVWHRVARCNGYGPTADLVNVWVAGRVEPLRLPAAAYFKVRDPEPSPFTVVGVRYDSTGSFSPIAAVAGVVPVFAEPSISTSWRPEAHIVTAPTADKALLQVEGTPAAQDAADVAAERWTVVGLFDRYTRSSTALAALAGEQEILGRYESMGESRQVTVVDAPDAAEAMRAVGRSWQAVDDEGDDW